MFVTFTLEGGPDNGKKVAVNGDHVDCAMQQDGGSTVIYFVGRKEDREKGWFNCLVVSEDFATVVSELNTECAPDMLDKPDEFRVNRIDSPAEKTGKVIIDGKEVDDSIVGV